MTEMEQLQMRLDAMETELQKARAYKEVQNLMAKYLAYHDASYTEIAIDELFVKETPGWRFGMGNGGVWTDLDVYKEKVPDVGGCLPGKLIWHTIQSPIVEVADDLQTAKGYWTSIGLETFVWPENEEFPVEEVNLLDKAGKCPVIDGNKVCPRWNFEKVAVDCVKENGEWKIWHMATYDVVHASFYEDWVTLSDRRNKARIVRNTAGGVQLLKSRDNIPESVISKSALEPEKDPYWFAFDTCYPLKPEPPKPYATWDDSMSCC